MVFDKERQEDEDDGDYDDGGIVWFIVDLYLVWQMIIKSESSS